MGNTASVAESEVSNKKANEAGRGGRAEATSEQAKAFNEQQPLVELELGAARPAGAVRVTRDERAALLRRELRSDQLAVHLLPLNAGPYVQCVVTAVSTGLVNAHFRKHFRITRGSHLVTYVSSMFVAGSLNFLCWTGLAARPLFDGSLTCPTCYVGRTALTHSFFAFFYPVLMCSVGAVVSARRHVTFPIPPLSSLKESTDLFRHALAANRRNLISILIFNGFFSIALAILQYRAFENELLPRVFNRYRMIDNKV